MVNWTVQIRKLIPQPCYERPFICDGFPSGSSVIVIGENPATPMKKDWWSYWRPDTGFQFEDFASDYLVERSSTGKGISNTRRRLNRFRENGVKCVETNAFRNEKPDGVGEGTSNFEILDFLIGNMPDLKGIVAHGRIAAEYLRAAPISKDLPIYETRHFRMESHSKIDEICSEVHGNT